MALVSDDQASTKYVVRCCHLHCISILVRVAQSALVEQIVMRSAAYVDRVMMLGYELTINEHVITRTFPARLQSINHEIGMVIP